MNTTAAPTAAAPTAAATTATQSRHGRHDPWKAAFFVIAVVALIAGVAWALLGSSLFVVRSVQVSGVGPSSTQRVLAVAGIKLGTPLIRVNTADVARKLEGITRVQSARVRRSWPDAVVIQVVPRKATFVVRTGASYVVMDSYGVILNRTGSPPAGLVRLKPPDRPVTTLRGDSAVLAAGTITRKLPAWLAHRVVQVRAPRAARVVLKLRHGITVVWGGAAKTAQKAAELAVLLPTKATYYDVSDPESATTR